MSAVIVQVMTTDPESGKTTVTVDGRLAFETHADGAERIASHLSAVLKLMDIENTEVWCDGGQVFGS